MGFYNEGWFVLTPIASCNEIALISDVLIKRADCSLLEGSVDRLSFDAFSPEDSCSVSIIKPLSSNFLR